MGYWAATQVQPRCEQRALFFLELAGFEVYLPRVHEQHRRYGRRVQILAPLFPGYCFVRIELQWRRVNGCPGVIRLVANGGEPVPVPDKVVVAIRKRERNGIVQLPRRQFKIGDQVHVIEGALAGHFGLFAGIAAHERAVVLLRLLGADRQVKLAEDAIELV